jgi:hypothetical protein
MITEFSSQHTALIIPGIEASVLMRARIMNQLKISIEAFSDYALCFHHQQKD